MPAAREFWQGPLQAVGFLTVIPLPARWFSAPAPVAPAAHPAGFAGGAPSLLLSTPPPSAVPAPDPAPAPVPVAPATAGLELDDAVPWFPVVGGAIGAFAGLIRAATVPLFGRSPATVLAIIAAVVLTGGLHQDGLADTADGLGVRGDRERRLAVMRDSAIGTFGTLALIGWALLLYVAVAPFDQAGGLRTLVVAGALSRTALVFHGFATEPARSDGLGSDFDVSSTMLTLAGCGAVVITLPIADVPHGLVALLVAGALVGLWDTFCQRSFGGRTGDTLGAVAALVEVSACLALLAVA